MASAAIARQDGRLARSARSRNAVVDALLGLIEAGDLRPTAARIAERAGVSLRLLFQHFEDMEELFAAAADRQTARVRSLSAPVARDGALATRVDAFTRQRARICEAITPVRRASVLMEPFSREIAQRLGNARRAGRLEVERLFAAELAARTARDRREIVAAIAAAAGWSTWEALRRHHGLPPAQARRVMARTVSALLRPAEGD